MNFLTQKKIQIRNEVDHYGFSYLLSKRFNLKHVPKSYACFSHGWIWRTDLKVEDFGYSFSPRKLPIVVATRYQQNFLLHKGFATVYAGGLPFAYVEKSSFKRRPGSLLIMPPHSAQLTGVGLDSKLLDYIEDIASYFSEICVSLHVHDYENQELTNHLKKRNIRFILGADPIDANSLNRMRQIFDYFDYVSSTIMGSHILYAAFCGCKVSLLRTHLQLYSRSSFINQTMLQSIPGHVARMLDNFNNFPSLESRFPWLFVNHPLESIQMTEWAIEEIGFSNLLSKDIMMDVLGWTLRSRVRALVRAVSFRVNLAVKACRFSNAVD